MHFCSGRYRTARSPPLPNLPRPFTSFESELCHYSSSIPPPENQRPAQWFLHSGREPRAEPTPDRHNTTSAGLGTSSTMALSKSDRMIILLVINGIFFVVELCVGTSLGS
jgi:hypothetical protein